MPFRKWIYLLGTLHAQELLSARKVLEDVPVVPVSLIVGLGHRGLAQIAGLLAQIATLTYSPKQTIFQLYSAGMAEDTLLIDTTCMGIYPRNFKTKPAISENQSTLWRAYYDLIDFNEAQALYALQDCAFYITTSESKAAHTRYLASARIKVQGDPQDEWVMSFDDDDIMHPMRLEVLWKHHLLYPDVVSILSLYEFIKLDSVEELGRLVSWESWSDWDAGQTAKDWKQILSESQLIPDGSCYGLPSQNDLVTNRDHLRQRMVSRFYFNQTKWAHAGWSFVRLDKWNEYKQREGVTDETLDQFWRMVEGCEKMHIIDAVLGKYIKPRLNEY